MARGLSAGRVQSVSVKLIVDREKEIAAFIPEEYWKLQAVFTIDLKRAAELFQQWRDFLTPEDDEPADDGTDSAPAAGPSGAQKRQWLQANAGFRAELVEFEGKKFEPRNSATARRAAEAVGLSDIQIQSVANDGTNGPRGIPAQGSRSDHYARYRAASRRGSRRAGISRPVAEFQTFDFATARAFQHQHAPAGRKQSAGFWRPAHRCAAPSNSMKAWNCPDRAPLV